MILKKLNTKQALLKEEGQWLGWGWVGVGEVGKWGRGSKNYVPYSGHPTNVFYKLANEDIFLLVHKIQISQFFNNSLLLYLPVGSFEEGVTVNQTRKS